ncbi:unnamed protein product, partial [Acanthoscelides obtectus]
VVICCYCLLQAVFVLIKCASVRLLCTHVIGTIDMILLYLLVIFITTPVFCHNPLVDPNICGTPTCKDGTKFRYGPGTQQNYKYTVQIRSLFNGTSSNESTLYIQATASLSFLSPCDGRISLSEVTLKHDNKKTYHPKSMDFAGALTLYPLRFSFEDGVISELCPRKEEVKWVLNFKRGLLSMIHNSMKRFDLDHVTSEENDVRGKCPTKYSVMGAKETSLIIEKTKQLDSCVGRAKFHSIIQSTPWPASRRFDMKDNIVKSHSHCTISVDHNIYKGIQCEESHLLEPFSNNGAGASTVITQSLELLEEIPDTTIEEPEITRRETLNFDHSEVLRTKDENIDVIDALLKKEDKSGAFTELVHKMRDLTFEVLENVYKRTKAQAAKKQFISALPYVRSGASVTLMKDLILSGSVPEASMNEWMISIAFIPSPDDDMMEAILQLLKENTASPNIALSVATLTHTYCSQRAHCQEQRTVRGIVNHLEMHFLHMYSGQSFDRQTTDNIMVTLKALSNIGVISEDFEQELFKVIANSNLASGIRVAAVETFRRRPCEKTRSYFESIFRNQDEDAEVRIASYLQIMRCPSYLLIRALGLSFGPI